jgi:hypothetical protein
LYQLVYFYGISKPNGRNFSWNFNGKKTMPQLLIYTVSMELPLFLNDKGNIGINSFAGEGA